MAPQRSGSGLKLRLRSSKDLRCGEHPWEKERTVLRDKPKEVGLPSGQRDGGVRLPVLSLFGFALVALGLVLALVKVVLPAAAPAAVQASKPLAPALTRHLLLVVVDGLRFDVANDPAKMPHFAAAMQQHASGELLASRVTMTTSAIMGYGTGQPGRFEQIVRNINPDPPAANSWLANAKAQGLTLALVGDPAWSQMFGAHFAQQRLDPKGVAIDVDFNPQTFRDTRELLKQQPNFLVAHFVTPDHQAHAYGVFSQGYRNHIRGYDRELHALLSEVGPEWTVVVTSDHGAMDTGTHGSDTPIQRSCPVFAYGPGVVKGVKLSVPRPQIDLAPTLSLLLGVAPPAHNQGHLIGEWLQLPRPAATLCAHAANVLAYGEAALGEAPLPARSAYAACESGQGDRVQGSRAAVRHVDAALRAATGVTSPRAWLTGAVTCFGLLLLALGVLRRRLLRFLAPGAVLLGVALLMTFWVERLPGSLPNAVRAAAFVLLLLPFAGLLAAPGRFAQWLEAHPTLAPLLLPGLLLVTYTTNTRALAWIGLPIAAVVIVQVGRLAPTSPRLYAVRSRIGWLSFLALLLVIAGLYRAGFAANAVPKEIVTNAALSRVLAAVAVVLWCIYLARSRRRWAVAPDLSAAAPGAGGA